MELVWLLALRFEQILPIRIISMRRGSRSLFPINFFHPTGLDGNYCAPCLRLVVQTALPLAIRRYRPTEMPYELFSFIRAIKALV